MIACPFCGYGPVDVTVRDRSVICICPCGRLCHRNDSDGENWFLSSARTAGWPSRVMYLRFVKGSLWMMTPWQAPDLVPRSRVFDVVSGFKDLCLAHSVLSP